VAEPTLTRRATLARLGALLAVTFGVGGWRLGATEAAEGATTACVLTPEQTEGPYYIPREKLRRNITEGHTGIPLVLRTRVVDASTCRPIRGAAVDVWHADASGVYSGFGAGSASRTFMRGIQRTDAHGFAVFRTVYPGWYPGRTVHIHVKVHVGGRVVHTGQLYFPDAVTDAVYRKPPYSRRPSRDTRNADDAIYRDGGRRSLLHLRRNGAGYVAAITMGVRRS
jgi:protocatechuate 3,4-dioxygenase beta subunit